MPGRAYNEMVRHFFQTPIAPLIKAAQLRKCPKGQIVLYQGEVSDVLYIIESGAVKVYDIDEQGNEKVLHIICTPSIFPTDFFLREGEIPWFYATAIETNLYVLPREQVLESMRADGELATYLLRQLAREAHELMVRLDSLNKTTARDKLVAALKFLAVHHAREMRYGWRRVVFPVSHQLLADITGITRESATVAMKDLHSEKLIRNPRLTVMDINFEKIKAQ